MKPPFTELIDPQEDDCPCFYLLVGFAGEGVRNQYFKLAIVAFNVENLSCTLNCLWGVSHFGNKGTTDHA